MLELYAFVRPGEFSLPTVRGVAAATGMPNRLYQPRLMDDGIALIEADTRPAS